MNTQKKLPILNKIHQEEIFRYTQGTIPLLFGRLQKNMIDRKTLINIISVRYQVAHFFEDMLRYMIMIIEQENSLPKYVQEKLLYAVTENLKEELGEAPEYGGPHREAREVFLSALGIDYHIWSKDLGTYDNLGLISQPARNLINSLRRIISGGPIEAVAVLWYYENRISLDGVVGDYYILLKAFEQQFPEFKKDEYKEGDVLWHIASHAQHDEYHAALAENGLCEAVKEKDAEQRIKSACVETKNAMDAFWNEVYGEIK